MKTAGKCVREFLAFEAVALTGITRLTYKLGELYFKHG